MSEDLYEIRFDLLVPKFILFRYDVFPYIFAYAILFYAYFNVEESDESNLSIYLRLALIGVGFLNCNYSLIQAWLIFLVIGLKRCKHLFNIKNFQVPTKKICKEQVMFMFMRKNKAIRLLILFQIFTNNKSLNCTFSTSFKKNIITAQKLKVLRGWNQSLLIYL